MEADNSNNNNSSNSATLGAIVSGIGKPMIAVRPSSMRARIHGKEGKVRDEWGVGGATGGESESADGMNSRVQ